VLGLDPERGWRARTGVVPQTCAVQAELDVAGVFPIRHLLKALLHGFDPATRGSGIAAGDLAVVVAWGLAGLAIALWRFGWTPRSE
jgi:hypothetical protein